MLIKVFEMTKEQEDKFNNLCDEANKRPNAIYEKGIENYIFGKWHEEDTEFSKFVKTFQGIAVNKVEKQLKTFSPIDSFTIKERLHELIRLQLYINQLPAKADVSNKSKFVDALNRLYKNTESCGYGRLTAEDKKLLKNGSITIHFPPIMLGVSAILFYLRDILLWNEHEKTTPIVLEYNYPDALTMVERIIQRASENTSTLPDICIVGDAPGTALHRISNKEYAYSLAMMLPPSEHRLIRPVYEKQSFEIKSEPSLILIPKREFILSTPQLDLQKRKFDKKISIDSFALMIGKHY